LKAVLTLTDFRSSVIERPTSARVTNVFNAITNVVIDEYKKNPKPELMSKRNYRDWLKEINRHGGRRLYSTMTEEELETLFRSLAP
jgi:hypothetical protein